MKHSFDISFYIKIAVVFIVTVLLSSGGIIYLVDRFHFSDIVGGSVEGNTQDSSQETTSGDSSDTTQAPALAQIGELAPDFETQDLDGNKIQLRDYRDQNVLLIFWATWCSWCARELPGLRDFTDKNSDQIKIIALDRQEPVDVIREYVKQNNINFMIALDPVLDISNAYGVRGTPSHAYINKKGILIKQVPGYEAPEALETSFQELLESNES